MAEGVDAEAASAARVREVYVAEHARLWRSIYAFSASRDVADDATAEAFAQVLRRGDEVRDIAAWVWRAAYAIARGELQKRRRDVGLNAPITADHHAGDHELGQLLGALSELSETDRQLVVLCHLAGWKPSELSDVLGESPGALRVRLHRATRRARALLEDAEGGTR